MSCIYSNQKQSLVLVAFLQMGSTRLLRFRSSPLHHRPTTHRPFALELFDDFETGGVLVVIAIRTRFDLSVLGPVIEGGDVLYANGLELVHEFEHLRQVVG